MPTRCHHDHAQLHRRYDPVVGRQRAAAQARGSPSAGHPDVGNAALPDPASAATATSASSSRFAGRRRSSGACSTARRSASRSATVGANPDAARYAGMRPRRLIILTMTLVRPARRPGRRASRSWASAHYMTATYRHDGRLRRHHGRAARRAPTRSASSSPACSSGRCAPAPA